MQYQQNLQLDRREGVQPDVQYADRQCGGGK